MKGNYFSTFHDAIVKCQFDLETYGEDVDPGMWQGVPTAGHPDMETRELTDVHFTVPLPAESWTPLGELVGQINPNLPWADDHFEERVSRVPSNPGEQYKNWPWWRGQEKFTFASGAEVYDKRQEKFMFDHTYQERFWPKRAGNPPQSIRGATTHDHRGIRYPYGDLDDVVGQLLEYPYTRQAYLPIFFPEDTGNVHRGRIPCTLGYHFLLRNGQLHSWYTIRSCDFVRHFRDDLYLAARLHLWVLAELKRRANEARQFLTEGTGFEDHSRTLWDDVTPGLFHFHCFSLHMHKGDAHHVVN